MEWRRRGPSEVRSGMYVCMGYGMGWDGRGRRQLKRRRPGLLLLGLGKESTWAAPALQYMPMTSVCLEGQVRASCERAPVRNRADRGGKEGIDTITEGTRGCGQIWAQGRYRPGTERSPLAWCEFATETMSVWVPTRTERSTMNQ